MDFKANTTKITVQLVQDDQDPDQKLLELGTELCEQLGWQPGDQLNWIDNGDGSWTLTKQQT